jgi:hypothetical protein
MCTRTFNEGASTCACQCDGHCAWAPGTYSVSVKRLSNRRSRAACCAGVLDRQTTRESDTRNAQEPLCSAAGGGASARARPRHGRVTPRRSDDARCADAAAAPAPSRLHRARTASVGRWQGACRAMTLAVGGWLGACARIAHERTQAGSQAVAVATAQARRVGHGAARRRTARVLGRRARGAGAQRQCIRVARGGAPKAQQQKQHQRSLGWPPSRLQSVFTAPRAMPTSK